MRGIWLGLLLIPAVSACGSTPNTKAESRVPHWILSSRPIVEIGDSAGGTRNAYDLFHVTGAGRLSTGDVVVGVANGGTQEIRIFGTSGRHKLSIGRSGSGPGEFQALGTIRVIRGDSVIAYDELRRRVTVFDRAGRIGRSITVSVPQVRNFFRDGTMLGTRTSFPEFKRGVLQTTETLYRLSEAGIIEDTIGHFFGSEFFDTGPYLERRPFGKRLETAVGDSFVYVGAGDRSEVLAVSRDGLRRRAIQLDAVVEPVTEERINSLMTRLIATAVDPQRKEGLRRLRAQMTYPKTMPAHGLLHVSDKGDLWVQDYPVHPDSVQHWHVFGTDGHQLALVETPANFSIVSIGSDWVMGVWLDDSAREYIRVFRLKES